MNSDRLIFIVIGIFCLQACTYYTFSHSLLIKEIGTRHETFVFNIDENASKKINIISELNPTEDQIKKHFISFRNRELKICESLLVCNELQDSKSSLIFHFDILEGNPIMINTINEIEIGTESVVMWKSKYVWILFNWVYLRKGKVEI